MFKHCILFFLFIESLNRVSDLNIKHFDTIQFVYNL